MQVQIMHNVTTLGDLAKRGDKAATEDIARDTRNAKALAIFRRMPSDNVAPIDTNDRLALVGSLNFPEITGTDDAAIHEALNAAFAAGNAPYGPHVEEYRSWQVRSLSVGDVVLTQGRAFAVAGLGWNEIVQRWSAVDDATHFTVLGEFPAVCPA